MKPWNEIINWAGNLLVCEFMMLENVWIRIVKVFYQLYM